MRKIIRKRTNSEWTFNFMSCLLSQSFFSLDSDFLRFNECFVKPMVWKGQSIPIPIDTLSLLSPFFPFLPPHSRLTVFQSHLIYNFSALDISPSPKWFIGSIEY